MFKLLHPPAAHRKAQRPTRNKNTTIQTKKKEERKSKSRNKSETISAAIIGTKGGGREGEGEGEGGTLHAAASAPPHIHLQLIRRWRLHTSIRRIDYQGFIKDSSRIRPGFVQDCFRFLDVAFQMDSFSSDPAGTDASVRHGKRSVQDSSPIPRDSFAGTDPSIH